MNNTEAIIIDRDTKLHLLAILKRGTISKDDVQQLANFIGKDICLPSKMTDEEIMAEIARLKNIGTAIISQDGNKDKSLDKNVAV